MYPAVVAGRILSERLIDIGGHCFINWIDPRVSVDGIKEAVLSYQSKLDGPHPKVVSRFENLIEMFNRFNTEQMIAYRIDAGYVVFERWPHSHIVDLL